MFKFLSRFFKFLQTKEAAPGFGVVEETVVPEVKQSSLADFLEDNIKRRKVAKKAFLIHGSNPHGVTVADVSMADDSVEVANKARKQAIADMLKPKTSTGISRKSQLNLAVLELLSKHAVNLNEGEPNAALNKLTEDIGGTLIDLCRASSNPDAFITESEIKLTLIENMRDAQLARLIGLPDNPETAANVRLGRDETKRRLRLRENSFQNDLAQTQLARKLRDAEHHQIRYLPPLDIPAELARRRINEEFDGDSMMVFTLPVGSSSPLDNPYANEVLCGVREIKVYVDPFKGHGGSFDGGGASGDWASPKAEPIHHTPSTPSHTDHSQSDSCSGGSSSSGSSDSSSGSDSGGGGGSCD